MNQTKSLLFPWGSCESGMAPSDFLPTTFEQLSCVLLSTWLNNSSMLRMSSTRSLWVRWDVQTFSLPKTCWLGMASQFSFFMDLRCTVRELKAQGESRGGGGGRRGGGGGGGGGGAGAVHVGEGTAEDAWRPESSRGKGEEQSLSFISTTPSIPN